MVCKGISPSDVGDNITGDVLPSNVRCMTGGGIGAGEGPREDTGESCSGAALTTGTGAVVGTSTGFRDATSPV